MNRLGYQLARLDLVPIFLIRIVPVGNGRFFHLRDVANPRGIFMIIHESQSEVCLMPPCLTLPKVPNRLDEYFCVDIEQVCGSRFHGSPLIFSVTPLSHYNCAPVGGQFQIGGVGVSAIKL